MQVQKNNNNGPCDPISTILEHIHTPKKKKKTYPHKRVYDQDPLGDSIGW